VVQAIACCGLPQFFIRFGGRFPAMETGATKTDRVPHIRGAHV
jgi:hypothetical protein